MILLAYSVYDAKAACYAQPVFYKTEGEARRAFTNACNLKEHPFFGNPEDYTLFAIGDYDDAKGHMAAYTTPKPVCKALEVKGDPEW